MLGGRAGPNQKGRGWGVNMMGPILHMRKLRLGRVERLARGLTTAKIQRQGAHQVCLPPESVFLFAALFSVSDVSYPSAPI